VWYTSILKQKRLVVANLKKVPRKGAEGIHKEPSGNTGGPAEFITFRRLPVAWKFELTCSELEVRQNKQTYRF
jgi:hypothetical protein